MIGDDWHPYGCFHSWGYPNSWMTSKGKSQQKMDDEMGVPLWLRKPPYKPFSVMGGLWHCFPHITGISSAWTGLHNTGSSSSLDLSHYYSLIAAWCIRPWKRRTFAMRNMKNGCNSLTLHDLTSQNLRSLQTMEGSYQQKLGLSH